MESGSTPPDAPNDRIPRGAIAVVVVGVVATIAAALLTGGHAAGEAAYLEFVQTAKIPDSKPVPVPGSKEAEMQLVEGKIEATGTNYEDYSLFRVRNTLKIDKGAPVGDGRILCSIHAPRKGTEIGQSGAEGLRMLYPRSSEDGIYGQPVPEAVVAHFASHGHALAVLEGVDEDLPTRWSTIQGVKLDWGEFEEGTEHLTYFLPEGKAKATIELPFYSIWRTKKPAAAEISCRLEVAAGKATVQTTGSLKHVSPLIDEEAEEINHEEVEEAAEGEEEGTEGE